jgi:hypothetical protein
MERHEIGTHIALLQKQNPEVAAVLSHLLGVVEAHDSRVAKLEAPPVKTEAEAKSE